MTLIASGKTNENSIIITCDGRTTFIPQDGEKYITEDYNKIELVRKDIVVTGSGLTGVLDVFKGVIDSYLRYRKPNFDLPNWIMTFQSAVDKYIEREGLVREYNPDDFDTHFDSTVQIYYTLEGHPMISQFALLKTNLGKPPQFVYVGWDENITFPYRTAGRNRLANDILLDLALCGDPPYDADFTKAVLLYLQKETAKTEPKVGGKISMGEFKAEGFQFCTPGEIEERCTRIQQTQAKLESILSTCTLDRLEQRTEQLHLGMAHLNDLDVYRRLAQKRVKSAEHANSQEQYKCAVFLYEKYISLIAEEGRRQGPAGGRNELPIQIEPQLFGSRFITHTYKNSRHSADGDEFWQRYKGRTAISYGDIAEGEEQQKAYQEGLSILEKFSENANFEDMSWHAKALQKTGYSERAMSEYENMLHLMETSDRNKHLNIAELIAIMRLYKGLITNGRQEYLKHFNSLTVDHLQKGELTREMIKSI